LDILFKKSNVLYYFPVFKFYPQTTHFTQNIDCYIIRVSRYSITPIFFFSIFFLA